MYLYVWENIYVDSWTFANVVVLAPTLEIAVETSVKNDPSIAFGIKGTPPTHVIDTDEITSTAFITRRGSEYG